MTVTSILRQSNFPEPFWADKALGHTEGPYAPFAESSQRYEIRVYPCRAAHGRSTPASAQLLHHGSIPQPTGCIWVSPLVGLIQQLHGH